MRQPPPLGSRTWKPEEEDYLMEKWGQISVPAIAKKLNRTTNAVKVRAQRLGLSVHQKRLHRRRCMAYRRHRRW